MKPVSLIISAWGPYRKKECIDFAHLTDQGVFLISGPTGAGKTTIFDAITFSLFGEVSGSIREKDSVRSDFAEEEDETYVDFIFTHRGRQYEVKRNPKYNRPKKRGSGLTAVKESAILKAEKEVLVEGSREVNAKIEEILSLNYKQFTQISMLAQGEFQKLLTAAGSERTKIFRNLFHTQICENFQNMLSERSRTLYGKVRDSQARMHEILAHILCEEEEWLELKNQESLNMELIGTFLEKHLQNTKEKRDIEKKNWDKVSGEIKKIYGEKEEAKRYRELEKRLSEAKERLEQLSVEKETYQQWKKNLKIAEEAEGVFLQEAEFMTNRKEYQRRMGEWEKLLEEEAETKKQLMQWEAAFAKTQRYKEQIAQLEEVLRKLIEKQRWMGELETAEEALKKSQVKFLEKQKRRQKAQSDYETAEETYKLAAAGLLAKELKEGTPCPVCGAIHHPQKAQLSDEIPEKSYVEKLKKLYEECAEDEREAHSEAAAQNSRAEMIRKKIEEIFLDTVNEDVDQIFQEKSREKQKLQQEVNETQEHVQTVRMKHYNVINLKNIRQVELQKQKEAEENSFLEYQKKLKENGFFSEEEFQKVKPLCNQKQYYKTQIKEYEAEKLRYNERKENCEKELKGRKRLDYTKIIEQLQEAEEKEQLLRKSFLELQQQYENNKRLLREFNEKQQEIEEIQTQYGKVSRMEQITRGHNQRNLVFEQYVLSNYFDEILRAANKRFSSMSAGRYLLKRVDRAEDARSRDSLLMEVFDAYTGKNRSVQTLSGGESFQASLALALGMSDMIQAFSGGIVVETMFVDEGFGSLDEESIEQAVEVLIKLAKQQYTIGIISHVNELKEKIERQLLVEKTSTGSRISFQR